MIVGELRSPFEINPSSTTCCVFKHTTCCFILTAKTNVIRHRITLHSMKLSSRTQHRIVRAVDVFWKTDDSGEDNCGLEG